MADQRHLTDDTVERLAQGGWRVDDDGLECDHGLRSAPHSGIQADCWELAEIFAGFPFYEKRRPCLRRSIASWRRRWLVRMKLVAS